MGFGIIARKNDEAIPTATNNEAISKKNKLLAKVE